MLNESSAPLPAKAGAAIAALPASPRSAPAAVEDGLEELADDAVGEVALVLSAARSQHPEAARLGTPDPLGEQSGLARPGLAFDDQRARFACRRRAQ